MSSLVLSPHVTILRGERDTPLSRRLAWHRRVAPYAIRTVNLVSLTFASWNQIGRWIRQLDGLREAALPEVTARPRSLKLKAVPFAVCLTRLRKVVSGFQKFKSFAKRLLMLLSSISAPDASDQPPTV